MNRTHSPTSSRWAIILLSAAVLALGGCGRKGGLDLPPNRIGAGNRGGTGRCRGRTGRSKPSVFNPTYGTECAPGAPKGSKKAFILDPLLND